GTNLRQQDIFSRIGGEEFAILLPGLDVSGGQLVAEKLREAIATNPIDDNGTSVSVSATLGLVAISEDIDSEEQLQQIADRALYLGKQKGRNCVITADKTLY
ncbi:MAG TPA: GGDEF domain-containing protein, partial [Idiomarina sp.]|nr:GGDEF domain-containing protein [Idiomarina sp.]